MRLWWHKLTHWEYWPVEIVYAVTALFWLGFAIRLRRASFYKFANPAIHNGGLSGDRKSEIYKLLPIGTFPKTILVDQSQNTDPTRLMNESGLTYPVIVKPDIGLRGIAVHKVHSHEALMAYSQNSKEDFLIQELIEYPNEIGLFYCRYPSQQNGTITGLTLKKFLNVEGNGRDSILQLLMRKPRFELQIPKLRDKLDLNEVLKDGEIRCLVPFGNHNRGTEFLDGAACITPKLQTTFDNLLKNVEGFYFGRLDIRFNTFEELEAGKNFSIIELNGAKSEPTHIYDPKHSFWYGQKEVFRHQKMFYRVINEVLSGVGDAKGKYQHI